MRLLRRANNNLYDGASQLLLRNIGKFEKRYYSIEGPLTVPPQTDRNINVTVDGRSISVPPTATIMQACAAAGVDIPRFCYHERLGIAGNCRMCLVQVNGGGKLMASCAVPVMRDMRIETASEPVLRAREGVMEFLLANHPLDCPICDQGGECDLQDQSMAFGSDRGRFRINLETKRAVEDKHLGPLIKTSMNRCIHCTRCVRFANEIAGVDALGTTGRGNDMQIGTYDETVAVQSELSGNLVDLCPVGALTSRPYAFTARPWELHSTETVDVLDSTGASIRVDSRGVEVMRILPRLNESVNEEWISDKTRFACDGLRRQRLTTPLARDPKSGYLVPITWEQALVIYAERLRTTHPDAIEAVAGDLADLETLVTAKDLLGRLGCTNLRFDGEQSIEEHRMPIDSVCSFRFNARITGIDNADAALMIGTNLRTEAPLLNARLRRNWLRTGLPIGVVLETADKRPPQLTFPFEYLGGSSNDLKDHLLKSSIWKKMIAAKRPMILISHETSSRPEFQNILLDMQKRLPNLVSADWNGICHLPLQASRVGALEIGWRALHSRSAYRPTELTILLNADNIKTVPSSSSSSFTIYQGHHGDVGVRLADLVLPTPAYTEKDAGWVNLEGRVQRTKPAVPMPGEARLDWTILRAVADVMGANLGYAHPSERLAEISPNLVKDDTIFGYFDASPASSDLSRMVSSNQAKVIIDSKTETSKDPVVLYARIPNFYLTDPISRASPTMAQCSAAANNH